MHLGSIDSLFMTIDRVLEIYNTQGMHISQCIVLITKMTLLLSFFPNLLQLINLDEWIHTFNHELVFI